MDGKHQKAKGKVKIVFLKGCLFRIEINLDAKQLLDEKIVKERLDKI